MQGKRGQGLSTNAIVLMVLGVIILIVLIVGFTIGFSKLNPFLGSNNVNTVVTLCSTACSINNVYEFCSLERTLKADDLPSGDDGESRKEVIGTCNFFADEENSEFAKYGIQECPAFASEVACSGL